MAPSRPYTTEHTLTVDAPPHDLYALVADVGRWPAVFEPCVHVHHLERGEHAERFELWAQVGGGVSHWTSRRELDPRALRVTFAQEVSQAPIASMRGEWRFVERPGGRTQVVLLHWFTAVEEDAGAVRWISEALDRNSAAELTALGAVASGGCPVGEVLFSFTDIQRIPGPARAAYAFVHRADRWAELLPHVAGVELTETPDGVQDLRMETVTADGAKHSTASTRVCRDGAWIAYKQRVLPRLLLGHSGLWTFTDEADAAGAGGGSVATATHTVRLDPGAVESVLGTGRTLADARAYLRDVLGRNSTATLSHAARYAAARGADTGSAAPGGR
ncbi:SRPBCC family protein [Streptomyces sp. NPDC101133]|uniref:aromatase/cyclase n=1 Tax=Streptomyces sp. NPDC101133 TaxID=3366111 RepID=UPI003811F4C1